MKLFRRIIMKGQMIFLGGILMLTLFLPFVSAQPAMMQNRHFMPWWTSLDIGQVGQVGATNSVNDRYLLTGSGTDIGNRTDQFHYAALAVQGDGVFVVHIINENGRNGWAKAGIMIRETEKENAANVFIAVTPRHGLIFQWRSSSSALTRSVIEPSVKAPYWLKLTRYHNRFTGSFAHDGRDWKAPYSIMITMHANIYIGLAVTSHNNRALETATFADADFLPFSILPTPTPTPTPTATPTPSPTPIRPHTHGEDLNCHLLMVGFYPGRERPSKSWRCNS